MSKQMQISVPIRAPTWVSTRRIFQQKLQDLHKCTNLNHIKQVHAQILKQNLHQDLYVAPKLISAFSLSQEMSLAINVFKQIPDPNVHLYNTFIRACVQNSHSLLAFETFFEMQRNGLFADNFTYPFLLKACNGQSWLPLVKMIHNHLEKYGFFQDLFVPNSLIDSYCKCGLSGVKSAMRLFKVMDERDVVSWNSMIRGLLKVGELSEACKLFDEMPMKDAVSWNTILDGYVKAGEMNKAFGLFESMPERNVVSWSTMVSGYCKAGDMEMARMLFDRMPVKNLVSWTIIVSGYAVKGLAKDAIRSFEQMEEAGLKPDDGTVISILASCAESGLLGLGKKMIREAFSPRKKKDSDPFATAVENTRKRTDKNERGRERERGSGLTSSSSRRASRSLSPYRVSEYPWEQDKQLQKFTNQSAPNPKASVPSNSSSSKSSSKKWRLRDFFLFRSASEGHAHDKDYLRKYSGLFKKHEDGKDPSFRSTDSSGSVSSKRKVPVSAHELHYTANKAVSENMKKKTFLPYKQGFFGRLAFNPAAHALANGFGNLTR